jgi:cyclohexyl-isocyanide hydratase
MPGAEFQTVARTPGPVKVDMGLEIVATHSFDSCWSDPDVLFVPGGGIGAFNALQDDGLLEAMARIGGQAKWVTSVCTGSLLLGAAGLTKGYRSACYWHARPCLAAFGAIPDDARIVIDRNRASGGGVTSGIDFALAIIGKWGGLENGRLTELLIEYAPQPPFGVGRPELASPETVTAAESILKHEMPAALVEAAARRRGFIA